VNSKTDQPNQSNQPDTPNTTQLANLEATQVDMYSDGSFMSKQNIGGWGFVFVENGQAMHTDFGARRFTSSLGMELLAAVSALEFAEAHAQPNQKRVLHTDSKILIEGLEGTIARYHQQNWLHPSGKAVKGREMWEKLEHLTQHLDVTVKWVKGHNGNPGNQLADQLARQAIETFLAESHH